MSAITLRGSDRSARGRMDRSAQRAGWWLEMARAEDPSNGDVRRADYTRALALIEDVAPHDALKVTLLTQMGHLEASAQDFEAATRRYRQAIAAASSASGVADGEVANSWGALGAAEFNLGHLEAAAQALRSATDLSLRTYGTKDRYYWSITSKYAQILHMNGHRDEAMKVFEELRAVVPDPPTSAAANNALALYAQRLVAQGEPARGLPWLEADVRYQEKRPDTAFALRLARWRLGEAYAELGRDNEARSLLKQAFDEYSAQEPAQSTYRLQISERWARLLLDEGHIDEAEKLFEWIMESDRSASGEPRASTASILAELGLARALRARGHLGEGLAKCQHALQRWGNVQGVHDVRMGSYLRRECASMLLVSGARSEARSLAAAALTDSERFDAPGAKSIAGAKELLRLAANGS